MLTSSSIARESSSQSQKSEVKNRLPASCREALLEIGSGRSNLQIRKRNHFKSSIFCQNESAVYRSWKSILVVNNIVQTLHLQTTYICSNEKKDIEKKDPGA
ncbi:hypothetical protein CHS0354_027180 [Potamilus streckersoni]|uniref:Uncharacterized protein n=1 Tax=Potamilus streckersoni TaxID=2493646 RepID=A0AAE0T2Y6_9BIVA|nr:hypothetical protein CHS0354_027180 [Potamilus streckersoni]